MGKIAEALRANLRELAQADARLLRELDGALPADPEPMAGAAGALADGLDALSVSNLKALCKQRGQKGYSNLNKADLIQRLRGCGAPLATKEAAKFVASPSGLAAIAARLDRLEALLQRVAERVGVNEPDLD
ncbi:MAG: hypothetical protein ACK46L_09495 [Synechococcaceae cyanobacterium]|jgi:hypothetical protein